MLSLKSAIGCAFFEKVLIFTMRWPKIESNLKENFWKSLIADSNQTFTIRFLEASSTHELALVSQ